MIERFKDWITLTKRKKSSKELSRHKVNERELEVFIGAVKPFTNNVEVARAVYERYKNLATDNIIKPLEPGDAATEGLKYGQFTPSGKDSLEKIIQGLEDYTHLPETFVNLTRKMVEMQEKYGDFNILPAALIRLPDKVTESRGMLLLGSIEASFHYDASVDWVSNQEYTDEFISEVYGYITPPEKK